MACVASDRSGPRGRRLPPPHEQRSRLPEPVDEVPSTSSQHITKSPSGRPIDVEITVLEGSDAAERITTTLRQDVEDLVAAWDAIVGAPVEDDADQPDPELHLEVAAVRLGERLVSLELDGFRYLGGASGDEVAGAWTFATTTGEQLELADVGMFEEAEAALRAGEVSLERWSVTDEALRIHFPEYEVAPGAAGAPVAQLPLVQMHEVTGTATRRDQLNSCVSCCGPGARRSRT